MAEKEKEGEVEVEPEALVAEVEDVLAQLRTPDEAIAQAVSDLSNVEKIELFTHIVPGEELAYAMLMEIAETEGFDWLRDVLVNMFKLRVSWKRLGRREHVRMVTSRGARGELEKRRWFRWPWQKRQEGEE